jgi:hypothetical protein
MDRFLLSLPRKQPEVAHLKSPPLDAPARNKVNPKPYLLYPSQPLGNPGYDFTSNLRVSTK